MSRDINPSTVDTHIDALSRQLEAAQQQLADLDEAATIAEHKYEMAFARAILTATGGNAETRKAEATVATEDLLFAARIAAQQVRAAKAHMSTLENRIGVGRSLLSAQKAAWGASGYGGAA